MTWLKLWEPVGDEETVEGRNLREGWERKLRAEVAPGHVLPWLERQADCSAIRLRR